MLLPLCYNGTSLSYLRLSSTAWSRQARGTRQLLPRLRTGACAVRVAPACAPPLFTHTAVQCGCAPVPVRPGALFCASPQIAPRWLCARRLLGKKRTPQVAPSSAPLARPFSPRAVHRRRLPGASGGFTPQRLLWSDVRSSTSGPISGLDLACSSHRTSSLERLLGTVGAQ